MTINNTRHGWTLAKTSSHRRLRQLGATMLLSVGCEGALAQGQDNYWAPDVLYQWAGLGSRADSLAFHLTEGHDDAGDSGSHHNQGIARNMDKNGVPHIYVAHNNFGGTINVVRLESRQDGHTNRGERMRSNLVRNGVDTDDTLPPLEDRVVFNIRFGAGGSDFLGSGRNVRWEHPGGMQIIDDMLIVACFEPYSWSPPRNTGLVLIDVKDPSNPTYQFTIYDQGTIQVNGQSRTITKCGAVAIARDPTDEKYIIAAMHGLDGYNEDFLSIFKTSVTDLRDLPLHGDSITSPTAVTLIDTWSSAELGSDSTYWEGAGGGMAFQSINFVRQSDGQLFLLCGRSTDGLPDSGNEYLYLFSTWFAAGDQFKLAYQGRRELNRDFAHTGVYADFGAAGGVTVTPRGELLAYSAPHYNRGPVGPGGNTQRFSEYHYDWGAYANNAGPSNAFVKIWEHPSGWLVQDSRAVVFDAADDTGEDYFDLNLHEDFDNRARSLALYAPPGVGVRFYDRAHRQGKSKLVWGTGRFILWSDLDQIFWDDGVTSLAADGIEAVDFVGEIPSSIHVPEHPGFPSPVNAEAVLTGNPASVISIRAGSYPGYMLFDKAATIRTRSGTVTLGR